MVDGVNEMSIALVGAGYWGKNIARVLNERALLSSICDHDAQRAEKFSKMYDVPAVSLEIMLSSDCVAVAIALPAEAHFEIAKLCLLAGKHVFIEKPLALDVSECKELMYLAENLKLEIMVGHILQFHNCFKKLKEMVQSKEFGELKKIEATRHSFGKIRSNENVMWSFAPHDLSMIFSIVESDVQYVDAQGTAIIQDDIYDTAKIDIGFKNGIKAEVSSSWLSPHKRQMFVATTTEAIIVFDDTAGWDHKLRVVKFGVESQNCSIELSKMDDYFVDIEKNEPLSSEIHHFWQVVCGKMKNTISNVRDGIKVVEILERANSSMRMK